MVSIKSSRVAQSSDVIVLCDLINSAYRGESSKKGWTTEADLLGGQRTDPHTLSQTIAAEGNVILIFFREGDQKDHDEQTVQNDLDESNELIGCILLQNRTDRAYIGMLTVSPELQAAGLGRLILATAESWVAENWGLHRFEMTVIQKRMELISWYERRGYRNTGKKLPFPYGDERFGLPKVSDIEFVVLQKVLES